MKILFLINNLGNGGAEKVLVNLANALAYRGYDITIRTLVDEGSNKQYLSSSVKYEYIFKKYFKGVGRLHLLPHNWIYSKICYGSFDIIVAYLQGVITSIVSYGPKDQKKIAWLHTDMRKSAFIKELSTKNRIVDCYNCFDRIIAVSETVKSSFIEVSGISENVEVLYNTFDIDDIIMKSKQPCCLGRGIRLCSVGKLEKVKGYLRLLSVFHKLVDIDHLDLSLTIVGEGSQRGELERYIAKNHLESRVKLVGFDTNPYKYIANSDAFVCSSFYEGFSSVVAESLILGIPVVSTDVSGAREMLGDSEFGLVVENSDEGIYTGIKSELENLSYWKAKAEERSKFFSIDEVVGSTEKMLKSLL